MRRLTTRIAEQYGTKPPVVLDMFSGRGIIPLEAARVGASAIGTDLSPVATLARPIARRVSAAGMVSRATTALRQRE